MHFQSGILAALLLASEASSVSAKIVLEAGSPLSLRHLSLDESVRRQANRVVEREIMRRTTSSTAAESSAAENFNTPEWNATTTAACTTALDTISSTSNSAGMLACYNIPFLDTTTGVFEADLRLYQISSPTGDFAGVKTDQISVSLEYPDATISSSNSTANKVRKAKRSDTTVSASTTSSISELQDFQFVGQVNQDLSLTILTNAQVQALIIPSIKLSAPSTSDASTTVSTNMTASDTVYFVNGVFKGDSISGAAAASSTAEAAAAVAAAGFVLPGTTFGIFPLGFIITCGWTVLFVLFVGLGTYGRLRFRDAYRSRVKAAISAGRSGPI